MMKRLIDVLKLVCALSAIVFTHGAWAQAGYQINVDLKDYQGDTMYLGYYMGNHQYVQDTVAGTNGQFVFQGDETLNPGMYIIIIPPSNEFIQLLIDQDQTMDVSAQYDEPIRDIQIEGSIDNQLYYDYVDLIKRYKSPADSLRALIENSTDESDKTTWMNQVDHIDSIVFSEQKRILTDYPETMTAMIIRMNQMIVIPEDIHGIDEIDTQYKKFAYYRKKFIEQSQLDDARNFRTPFMYSRIENIIEQLTIKEPDSISAGLDEILGLLENNHDAFKYYLIHFLNQYAKSKVVGQDAIYVHLAQNYYGKGKANWTEPEQLKEILANAAAIKPTLLGQPAPALRMQTRDKKEFDLYDVVAEFTILYFWNPDCGHCAKATPKLVDFYRRHQGENIKILTICGKTGKDEPKCWEYVDKTTDMDMLVNLTDEMYRSKFKTLYYVKTTPKIYILDKDKKILSKGIGVEQLDDVLNFYRNEVHQ